MTTTVQQTAYRERGFPRLVGRVASLSRHRRLAVVLVVATIAGALVLDIVFPSYPIAGFYLVPVTLAALTLRVRTTIAVSAVCLGLAVYVAAMQGRTDGPTITVLCFSILSGAGLIALSYLFKQVDALYETERATTARLESVAAQLQTLQEVVVLDSDRPLRSLLGRVIEQASQLLGSDGCSVYRLDTGTETLTVAASTGLGPRDGDTIVLGDEDGPIGRALRQRSPVAAEGDEAELPGSRAGAMREEPLAALLAVPLLVRRQPYGVLALVYREPRAFTDVDRRLAASFGGQVALAIENARLRGELEENAAATERSRLARDLHDSVTQSLFAASLKAEAVRRRWLPDSDEARQNVEDVERLARGALAEMRTLLVEMRPKTLSEASLAALLEQVVAATEGRTRADIDLSVKGAGQLPSEVTVAFYRIAQEALHNLEHHSGARSAWVMLDQTGPVVSLVVRDDGHGFESEQVAPERLGLAIMRERGEAAGIAVTVESSPGAGTVVTATWRRVGSGPEEEAT